ncbi:MAG: hypothetical protein FD180_4739, partial [Planctomycetota bacterium]
PRASRAASRDSRRACGSRAGKKASAKNKPDFVAFNSNNRRYHYPGRSYTPFRSAFMQVDGLARVPNPFIGLKLGYWLDFAGVARVVREFYSFVRNNPSVLVDPTGLKPPVFKGFEADRYQEHDAIIEEIVKDFNSSAESKQCWCCSTADQAAKIPDLTEAMIKAWLIQESGGGDQRSKDAWKDDPAQVNVPGDWSDYKKECCCLKEPKERNEVGMPINLYAAVMWLCRKGFGKSGQPARNRTEGTFDGWQAALQRYNGRSAVTTNDKTYSENYAAAIMDRATDPKTEKKIELPQPKPPEPPK